MLRCWTGRHGKRLRAHELIVSRALLADLQDVAAAVLLLGDEGRHVDGGVLGGYICK